MKRLFFNFILMNELKLLCLLFKNNMSFMWAVKIPTRPT